jgi:hypothetical protein
MKGFGTNDVRFASESGRLQCDSPCLLRANTKSQPYPFFSLKATELPWVSEVRDVPNRVSCQRRKQEKI